MGDSEGDLPASKKRVAGRQISKDNPELDDDGPEAEMGTFQRASEEVLAARRIVKVRRAQTTAAGSNPFTALRMVPPSNSSVSANDPSVQPDTTGDKIEMKDGAGGKNEKSEVGKGLETGSLVVESNGIEESDKKVELKTDTSTGKDASNVEGDAVVETTQLVEAEKDVENGEKSTERKATEETTEEGNESEKKPGGEETQSETPCEEKVEKEKLENKPGGEETQSATPCEEKVEKEKLENKPGGEETQSEPPCEEKVEKEKLENDNKDADAAKPFASLSSFQQLSSNRNAFTGLAGTGFGTSSFSFSSITKEEPIFGASSGSIFGFKSDSTSFSFGVGGFNNGSFSLQPTSSSDATKSGVSSMQEVPIQTGEENEKAVFTADAILYEYLDGGWKERGKGEIKLNVSLSDAEKARLIMRARGNYRLILNASLYPDMALTNMDKKGITFACINSAGDGKNELSTFALKFKDRSFVEEFQGAVAAHKGKKTAVLKTPENSPKASDD